MKIDKLSVRCEELLVVSGILAERNNDELVAVEHLLMGMTIVEGSARKALSKIGVTSHYMNDKFFNGKLDFDSLANLNTKIENEKISLKLSGNISFYIENAVSKKVALDCFVYPEDILFEIIAQCKEPCVKQILRKIPDVKDFKSMLLSEFDADEFLADIEGLPLGTPLGKNRKGRNGERAKKHSALETFGLDLTRMATNCELEQVIGRGEEIDRLIEVLGRKRKSNPCLVGEPGVGKTALVEGLAQRIVDGKTPSFLKGSRIVSINIGNLVSGSKFRGEFEARLEAIIEEVKELGNVILFIDEIHTISVGGAEGALSAGDILKPYLARGVIKCIGATTLDEYRTSIEKDGALGRRFQKISVVESSAQASIDILRRVSCEYMKFHDVMIEDDALIAAVEYSDRYIKDRFLPDKAFDLLDEACSVVKVKGDRLVTVKDIASVLYKATGIPVEKTTKTSSKRAVAIRNNLYKKVIGQDEAIETVSDTVLRSFAGLRDESKPIGSFVFTGPTGVGKTELAKCLASELFDGKNNFIRIDMSEYMEKHSVSKLIGSAPGYVGYKEGGTLTEAVRRNPYSLVLFDEIEKAHPDIVNLFLQVLDDGRLTDGQGKTVDFKNTIIVFTSNLYNPSKGKQTLGFSSENDTTYTNSSVDSEKALRVFASHFSPEFMNRIDDVIVFNPLDKDALTGVFDLSVKGIKRKLKKKGIKLVISSKSKDYIVSKCATGEFGARPLNRLITKEIETPLSILLLNEEITCECKIKVTLVKGKLKFSIAEL